MHKFYWKKKPISLIWIAIFHISLKLKQHYSSYAMSFECGKGTLFMIPNAFWKGERNFIHYTQWVLKVKNELYSSYAMSFESEKGTFFIIRAEFWMWKNYFIYEKWQQ